jgi:quinolinate synthase
MAGATGYGYKQTLRGILGTRIGDLGEVGRLKKVLNAVMLAHYYQEPEIQDLATFIEDSSGQAQVTEANVLVFCGLHFVADTVKIRNPTAVRSVVDLLHLGSSQQSSGVGG